MFLICSLFYISLYLCYLGGKSRSSRPHIEFVTYSQMSESTHFTTTKCEGQYYIVEYGPD